MENLLISKARKPKFELLLRIYDLNNVPLAAGTSYIKWHLPTSTSAEHRGRTDRVAIKEHKVSYDYARTIPLRLTISKDNSLAPFPISFEVVQDYSTAGRSEKLTIGRVELNLAEYVEEGEVRTEDEDGVVRRYLMQESKVNSTLKIGIGMRQIDGERNFVAPPLKTAPVFGGIAGIIAEQEENHGTGDLGHVANFKSRDHGELQDMYRRALAASWAANSYELSADQCIEDIFNGGDGWKHSDKNTVESMLASTSDEHLNRRHHRTKSDNTVKGHGRLGSHGHRHPERHTHSHRHTDSQETLTGTGPNSSEGSERGRSGYKSINEVDEFDVREDLCAWRLPDRSRP